MKNPKPQTQHPQRPTRLDISAAEKGHAYAKHALSGAMKASLATVLAATPLSAAVAATTESGDADAPSLAEEPASGIGAQSHMIIQSVVGQTEIEALKTLVDRAEDLVAQAKIALDVASLPITEAEDGLSAAQSDHDAAKAQRDRAQAAHEQARSNAQNLLNAGVSDLKLRRDEIAS